MIGNQHQVAGTEGKIHTAAGIGQHQGFHTESGQDPDRQGDLLLRKSFIIMDPSLKDHHSLAALLSEDQRTAVTGHGGNREIGDLGIGNADGIAQGIGIVSQTAAQNQTDFRTQCCAGFDEFCGPQDFFSQFHGNSSGCC